MWCIKALSGSAYGGQHAESRRDAVHDSYFQSQGFRTIRFWNDEVEQRLDDVCRAILRATGKG
jgi:very-short-patch-repair endonuclease